MEIAVTQQWEVWLTWNERDVSWIWCWMHNGIDLGRGAWQIDRPSNGSMWNSYSFQPVGQWMGYSFTDLGAEGCCRSLNALLLYTATPSVSIKLIMSDRNVVLHAFISCELSFFLKYAWNSFSALKIIDIGMGLCMWATSLANCNQCWHTRFLLFFSE